MSNELTLQALRAGGPTIEEAIKKSLLLGFSSFEIRTNNEWLCSAYAVEIDKSLIPSLPEAIVALSSFQLHWLEQWDRKNATKTDVSNIASKWLTPEFQRYSFLPLEKSQIDELIQRFFQGVEHLKPTKVEILVDGKHTYTPLRKVFPSEPTVSGWELRNEWNEIEILYETINHFGLYSWGTGA